MKSIAVETQSNGYKAEGIQSMIRRFEVAAAKLFPGCTVCHFYYSDCLDMADVVLGPDRYAHFNIASKRVSLCGYTCSDEDLEKFGSMTHNDELYNGKLLEITAKERDGHIKVFYTFGSDASFPFRGGWVEVEAPTMKESHAIFREHYPDREPGVLNCSDYYIEEQFNESDMLVAGNRGAFCHRRLTAQSQWPQEGGENVTKDWMEDKATWLFGLAHNNLDSDGIVRGFLKHYVLRGQGIEDVQRDMHFRTRYGDLYLKAAIVVLRRALEVQIEAPPRSEMRTLEEVSMIVQAVRAGERVQVDYYDPEIDDDPYAVRAAW